MTVMPSIVTGNTDYGAYSSIGDKYEYQYPEGLNLRPDTDLHRRIVTKIIQRVAKSHEYFSTRRRSWKEIDKTLTAYIPTSEAEEKIKRKDSRKPVSIVFPHSYAILETIVSSLGSLFLTPPIFKYSGVSGEDTVGAMLLEKVIQAHCKKFKADLVMHTAFKDSIAYGLGATFMMWKQKWGYRTQNIIEADGTLYKTSEPALLFEGNELQNIDPYLLILDPTYGAQRIQNSEFVGFITRTNYYNLIASDNNGGVFNVRYLRDSSFLSQYYAAKRDTNEQKREETDTSVLQPVDVLYIYINIIPKEWGVGESDLPEKWLFALAGDRVILQAQPLNLDHDMFPVAVCAPTFDGYSAAPLGRLELMGGMQELLNWFFNSHVANVRKTINDMIIYDPFVLNSEDIANPEPGKLVRARRAAWGKDIRGSIMQLQVNDITRQNINDASVVMSLMNKVSGADDILQGSLRSGGPERLSAAEFSATNAAALGRLESLARIVSSQFIQDIGYMLAMHTQQFMTQDVYVNTVGIAQEQLRLQFGDKIINERMKLSPQDLNIDYDVEVDSYDTRGSQNAELWIQLYQLIGQNPLLMQQYDMPRIFKYIASALGAKNVDNFVIQPTLMPTNDVMSQVDAGNLVAAEEVGNI